jgi:ATP-dependent DNA ligase
MTSSCLGLSGSANDQKRSPPPPPIYMAFDCLYLEGRDLRNLPFRERRVELEAVVENDHTLIFPARRPGRERARRVGAGSYRRLRRRMVAKDEASLYKGGRTVSWQAQAARLPRG